MISHDEPRTMTGDDLRAWRARRGWTQAEAAAQTGYARETWRSWEQGRRAISPRARLTIALIDATGTTPERGV